MKSEFNIIRSKSLKSSNVKSYRYNTETKELIIEFHDNSKYKYFDVDYNDFENITYGDAVCITEGENEHGKWWVGKTNSVGAAVWEFLINKNKKYEQMSRSLKKVDKDRLPVYEIVVDEFDETGMNLISIVENPAIEVKGMYFNGEKSIMEFKEIEDKQIIVGPALIPDMKIYREDKNLGQYFVKFSKETILKMVEKFNRVGSNRKINFEHTNRMVDAFIMEDWIVEDPVYDKSRKYGFEVPVGTYMIKVKIEDKQFWEEEVKGNGRFGFSIEGLLGQQLVEFNQNHEFASYTDYPEAAKENAKIALRWAEKNGWGDCGTAVGKQRANQLANGEPISEETISRMASFARHKQNSQKELGDGCGRLMWLAWGGDEGIEWAQRKLKQIREEKLSADIDSLTEEELYELYNFLKKV